MEDTKIDKEFSQEVGVDGDTQILKIPLDLTESDYVRSTCTCTYACQRDRATHKKSEAVN